MTYAEGAAGVAGPNPAVGKVARAFEPPRRLRGFCCRLCLKFGLERARRRSLNPLAKPFRGVYASDLFPNQGFMAELFESCCSGCYNCPD